VNVPSPFVFHTERRLVLLTGVRATNLVDLLSGLEAVPGSSIYFHTHQQYLSQHFEKPVFYNDFAIWVSRALLEERLAERLAAVDILRFTSVRELREEIVKTVRVHLAETGRPAREAPPGDVFQFCRSKSFVMPTGLVAPDVPAFFRLLPDVTNISLHFHFVTARLRLERPTDDFSRWFADGGRPDLAGALGRLDPYAFTLDELREQILRIGREAGKG
jgi:hypothetical protein